MTASTITPAPSRPNRTAPRSRDFVQSLERGLMIIRVFDSDHPTLTVSEIAGLTHLTRAAARRFALTLLELGYLSCRNDRYRLTPRVLELGYSYLSAFSFPEIALPHLERLVADTGEASEGCILADGDIVYVVRVPGPALMTISVNVGARRPAHLTAMGRALLADLPLDELEDHLRTIRFDQVLPRTIVDADQLRMELDRVREQGYALVDQELEEGLIAVAVPVRDRTGRARAAINLSTHIGRKTVDTMRGFVPQIQTTAAEIEQALSNSVAWNNLFA
ncbi:MAG: IclR family transcriptional regulator [Actinobacteria bacterium 69-20]|jgi:IclR family pca regulon transcriptional regulator|nr:helix-turn-helix domain-containing protein [Actinomycetota bacterium]OJV24780.1 MAG: IclR family transcriptional regulator [Actinobacteria bacterium 69-20]